MANLIDPTELMFTAFEPKVTNRFVFYVDGIPSYLIRKAARPKIVNNETEIKTYEELKKYKNIPEMMWSEFIDDTEGMTDFMVHNGTIVHQITYKYSETQHGVVADDWKYISPNNQPPEKIINWMNNHMKGFTGICNVQYRGTVIIEVALRCSRGGAYILNTKNKQLIKSINELCDHGTWDYNNTKDFDFEPFYSFKCFTTTPIVYVYPQHLSLIHI